MSSTKFFVLLDEDLHLVGNKVRTMDGHRTEALKYMTRKEAEEKATDEITRNKGFVFHVMELTTTVKKAAPPVDVIPASEEVEK